MSLGTKNRILCLVLTLSLLLTLIGCGRVDQLLSSTHKDALIINEVVTSNQLSLQDEVYGSPDWIELVNLSDAGIHLSSYYITDNVEAPQKAFQLLCMPYRQLSRLQQKDDENSRQLLPLPCPHSTQETPSRVHHLSLLSRGDSN